MTRRGCWLVLGALVLALPPWAAALAETSPRAWPVAGQGGDAAWREADRARREMQRQQRVVDCQNRVLAQQSRFASQADFLRARQACATTR
ncbi:hypothetical protein [Sediminicoccus sp. KRV36]|uniref:hypothetical protein n=1 Tax=Sediminicoccus sp. KRV36 TaxID=3133721 RepID=UPI00200BBB62|nr:hypothetical protein [Sediminicoccus rosea]UPY38093.1 hypothetical protein LHU95_05180 [Sediminicoccus rosea]